MPAVTIRDVAREAGVSITSVSHILRGATTHHYAPETVERVREAARRLNYQAHAAARMLRQTNSTMVGVAVRAPVLVESIVNDMVVATQRELTARGYQPALVEPAHMVPSHSHAAFPSPGLLAGMISVDLYLENDVPDFYQALKSRLPIVALYPDRSGTVDSVTTDREAGIMMAFEHLVERGHRRIAFAETLNTKSITLVPKIKGWRKAEKKLGINRQGDYGIDLSEMPLDARARFVVDSIEQMRPRPTAVVCTSDLGAVRVMAELSRRGFKVGSEIAVTGFDGNRWGEAVWPSLTTVAQPAQEMAIIAVARLLEIMPLARAGEVWQPRHQLVKPQLIVRESTPPFGKS